MRGSRLVARQRRCVSGVRDRVAALGGAQPRLRGVIAPARRLLTLMGGALADIAADVVLFDVTAGRQLASQGFTVTADDCERRAMVQRQAL